MSSGWTCAINPDLDTMKEKLARFGMAFILAWSTLPVCSQTLAWLSHYGNGNPATAYFNIGLRVAMDNTGGLYCAGSVGGPVLDMDGHTVTVMGERDILLAKLDSSGQTEWAVSAGGNCLDAWDDVGWVGFDGAAQHVVVAGAYSGAASFGTLSSGGVCDSSNLFLASYDTTGVCLWVNHVRTVGGMYMDALVDPSSQVHWFVNPWGGHAVFVDSLSQSINGGGAILARYGSDGDFQGAQRVMAHGQIADAEWVGDDWLLAGLFSPGDSLWNTPLTCASSGNDGFLARTDTSGSLQWLATVSSDNNTAYFSEVKRLASGKIIALGGFSGNAHFEDVTITGSSSCNSGFIAAYEPTGQFLWAVPIWSQQSFVYTSDLHIGPDGSIYVQGSTYESFTIDTTFIDIDASIEMFVAKLDTLGNYMGVLRIGRTTHGTPGSVLVDNDALFVSYNYDSTMVVDGTTVNLSGADARDLFVAKFDDLSSLTGVQQLNLSNETLYIHSNPNNGLCTIALPESLQGRDGLMLSVFDNTGQLVQRAPLEFTDGGLKLDVRAQAKGIYHVELDDGKRRYTGTLVYE